MCLNDWRIGNQIKSQITVFQANLTPRVFPRNANRVAMTVRYNSATTTGPVYVNIDGAVYGTLIQGFTAPRDTWSLENSGDLCIKEWSIYCPAGLSTVTVIEFTLPTGVIAAGLDEFRRAYPGSSV